MDVRRRMLVNKKSSSEGSNTVGSYSVNLNGEWELTTAVPNPDSTLYDGVYRSASNYNVNNGVSTMYITLTDCSSFKMHIRSYAESSWDYVMVSQLDQTITGSTAYNNATLVKAHTCGNQQSGTALSSYTLVEFTGIPLGMHTITVVYRKDSSVNKYDDRGYVLIEKIQDGSGDSNGAINIDNYLTIEALENGLIVYLSDNACEYCVDGDGNWKSLADKIATEKINSGQTLSFRGNLTPTSTGIGTFTISKACKLKGNCMSMLFGDNAANNFSLNGKSHAFDNLFTNCRTIVTVSDDFLPATTLENYCYDSMFYNCSNLTNAPKLPAKTLASRCYYHMFYGCTNLLVAPALPATSLSGECYREMFYGCTNLTTAPVLPALTLATATYCYAGMFYNCINLTTAPDLPATTLASYCYYDMFYGCKNLTIAPRLPATTLANSCYFYMFRNCTSLTTAPELPATTLADSCYYYMFQNCTNLTTAPVLRALTLATYCYGGMFYNCSKLNYIRMLATNISANYCLSNWVYSVATTGTFVKNPDMNNLSIGTSGIPTGWTVVDNVSSNMVFYINNIEYETEIGMSWEAWVNSEYNTCNAYIAGGEVGPVVWIGNEVVCLNIEEFIEIGQYYVTFTPDWPF